MKTFKDIISELTDPTPRRQKEFIDKHTVQIIDYPAGKPDQLSVKNIKKDKSKKASLHDGEDASVYEETMSDAEMKKREDIVKGMKKNKADFQKRYGDRWKSVMYATATKSAMKEEAELDEAMTHSTWNVQHPTKSTKSYKVKARTAGEAIRKAQKAAIDAGHMKSNVPNTVFQSKHVQKVNEEVELDEVSDKKLDVYRQKAFADQPSGDDGSDKYRKRKFGRDLAFDKQTGRAKVLATKEEVDLDEAIEVRHDRYLRSHGKKASGGTGSWMFTHKAMGDVDHKNEKEVYSAPSGKFSDAKKSAQQWAKKHGHSTVYVMEEVALDEVSQETLRNYHAKAALDLKSKREKLDKGTLTSKDYKQGQNRVTGLNRAANKMEEYMDEAFKAGAMKLSDGSSVKLTSEQALTLNALFNELNSSNKKKMEERLMSDAKGFNEILAFAKEAV
jgi:hypothetical protein